MRYAQIINGVVVNVVVADDGWTPPEGQTWAANEVAQIGWSVSGETFSPPSQSALGWGSVRSMAVSALDASDRVILRCAEAGIAVPSSWRNYRVALRVIASSPTGDATQPLPIAPPYPSGT